MRRFNPRQRLDCGLSADRIKLIHREAARDDGNGNAQAGGRFTGQIRDQGPRSLGAGATFRLWFVHAGGSAGLFSSIIGSWKAGETGSQPVTREVKA